MNNQFYNCVELLKERLGGNENVNTVLFGRTEDKDLYKKSIFPLAHINPIQAPLDETGNTVLFTFEVAVLDQRDISKAEVIDKFDGNDNLQDNLNLCYVVLNDLITWLRRERNTYNIEIDTVQSAQPLLMKDFSLLDGWVVTITLKQMNTQPICY